MLEFLREHIRNATGLHITSAQALSGGCIGEVFRVQLDDGTSAVAKIADGVTAKLGSEGYMLGYLAAHSQLPVPKVIYSSDTLLLMQFLEGDSQLGASAQHHAAELLAGLHGVKGNMFGLEHNTLIGGLHQPNHQTQSWVAFFREQRLLYAAHEAVRARQLPQPFLKRIEQFSMKLENWLTEPEYPALIHGDMWTTNILQKDGRITGFIDPAIYYAHPEIELAFSTLFNTFGQPFFQRYGELRPIEPGFFEERRDIYNLYPLLVHVRLFGGSYVSAISRILGRFGF